MPMTAAPAGVSLTTSNQTLVTNPSGSGERRTVIVSGVNKSSAEALVTVLDFMKGATANPILPTNFPLGAADGFERRKVLEPGDSIRGAASAANAIHITVDQVFAEPAS